MRTCWTSKRQRLANHRSRSWYLNMESRDVSFYPAFHRPTPDLQRNADKHCLTYKGTTIQVFDKVRIKIFVRQLEDHQRELVIELLEPNLQSHHRPCDRASKRMRTS